MELMVSQHTIPILSLVSLVPGLPIMSTWFLTNGDNSSPAYYAPWTGGRMNDKDLQVFAGFAGITTRAELAERLFGELEGYSVFDLQLISAYLEKDINALPSPYRERVRPYFLEQYFRRYGSIMTLREQGALAHLSDGISDLALFRGYCKTAADFRPSPEDIDRNGPFFGHFYFVVSAFYMFVLDEPGHPVGMPFPGGFAVKKKEDGYYCPIRDKEKDVTYSICNFCPAKQDHVP
jgi:uncharacterized protein (UPF0305 family)